MNRKHCLIKMYFLITKGSRSYVSVRVMIHNVQTRSAFVMCPALISAFLMFSVIRGFSGSEILSLYCSCEHGASAGQLMISPAVFFYEDMHLLCPARNS